MAQQQNASPPAQKLLPGVDAKLFKSPEDLFRYERAAAERKFRCDLQWWEAGVRGERRISGQHEKHRSAQERVEELERAAAEFVGTVCAAYGDYLIAEDLPPEEAIHRFKQFTSRLLTETAKSKLAGPVDWYELPGHSFERRLAPVLAAIGADFEELLWRCEFSKTRTQSATASTHQQRVEKLKTYLKRNGRDQASFYREHGVDKADFYRWQRQDPRLTPGIKEKLDSKIDSLPI